MVPGDSGGVSGRVFNLAEVGAPFGDRAVLVLGQVLRHCEVRHEVVRGGTVPVPLLWRCVDGVARPDLDHRSASGLDESPAFGDMQRLPVGVTVPRRVRAG